MKIRLKHTGEVVEANVNIDSNGEFIGFMVNRLGIPGAGMLYHKEDVAEAPDWDAYRMEAAKDILCAILRSNQTDDNDKPFRTFEDLAKGSVACADALIAKLKEK